MRFGIIKLTQGDYEELERVLTSELGSLEDYHFEFGDTPFVHKVINHIEQNGYMDNVADLQKPPFDKSVSFIKLFDAKTRTALMKAIKNVKDNAVSIAGQDLKRGGTESAIRLDIILYGVCNKAIGF